MSRSLEGIEYKEDFLRIIVIGPIEWDAKLSKFLEK